jgi:hypothetical protein
VGRPGTAPQGHHMTVWAMLLGNSHASGTTGKRCCLPTARAMRAQLCVCVSSTVQFTSTTNSTNSTNAAHNKSKGQGRHRALDPTTTAAAPDAELGLQAPTKVWTLLSPLGSLLVACSACRGEATWPAEWSRHGQQSVGTGGAEVTSLHLPAAGLPWATAPQVPCVCWHT